MRKIISLCGGANVGKTTTLNLVIDLLKIISSKYEIVFNRQEWQDEFDRVAFFELSEIKICICTSGDSECAINEALKYCKRKCCDIAILAMHVRDETKYTLTQYAETNSIDIITIRKDTDIRSSKKYATIILKKLLEECEND